MQNKELRIIIADISLNKIIQIEKNLNSLGYYRILPIQNIDDLWALDHSSIEAFDLIIANISMMQGAEKSKGSLLHAFRRINFFYFYDYENEKPCDTELKNLMKSIDPPSQFKCLKDLVWITAKRPSSLKHRHPLCEH